MKKTPPSKLHSFIVILLLISIAFIILINILLVQRDVIRMQRFSAIRAYTSQLIQKRNHGPLSAQDANLIRSWMTFDYVNKLFNLPSNYISTHLKIPTNRYPRETLANYAKQNRIDPKIFVTETENIVRAYLVNKK